LGNVVQVFKQMQKNVQRPVHFLKRPPAQVESPQMTWAVGGSATT